MVHYVGIDLEEPVSSWVIQPRVVVGASHASLQIDRFAGHLLRGQLARMWHPTRGNTFDRALFPPRLKVLHFGRRSRILDPLDHLGHRHKVHVVVVLQHLVDPVQEGVEEFGVVLQPGRMEVQTERCTILVVMPIEIVVEEVVELVAGQDVRARVHHSASGQVLVVGRILPAVELVHDHLPDGVRSRGARLQIAVATMRHLEVHGVRPQWRIG